MQKDEVRKDKQYRWGISDMDKVNLTAYILQH